jgi:uncharacterized RDD family membrane protein YckC
MYQVVGPDGQVSNPVDVAALKEMAADGRLLPATTLIDPISGQSSPASEMLAGTDVFSAAAPQAAPSFAAPPPVQPGPSFGSSASAPPTSPGGFASPPPQQGFQQPQGVYPPPPMGQPMGGQPGVAIRPDLGPRFIGALIDGVIAIPLVWLAVIPLVNIIGAPVLTAYWLGRDYIFKGQSVGKKVAKTRVVKLDGSPFTLKDSVMRNISFAPYILMIIPVIGVPFSGLAGLAQIVDLVLVVTSGNRMGDNLAKTQVVADPGY